MEEGTSGWATYGQEWLWLSLGTSALLYALVPWRPFPGSFILKGLPVAFLTIAVLSIFSQRPPLTDHQLHAHEHAFMAGSSPYSHSSPTWGSEVSPQRRSSDASLTTMIIALALHGLGDVLLELGRQYPRFMLPAICSFLSGHVLYLLSFILDLHWPLNISIAQLVVVLALTLGTFGVMSQLYVAPTLAQNIGSSPFLRFVVLSYTSLLLMMTDFCILTSNKPGDEPKLLNAKTMGGVLFLLSDALIGWGGVLNKPIPYLPNSLYRGHGWLIWPFYYFGQLLIVGSMMDIF